MSDCPHDDRFKGVSGLPGGCGGCLACYTNRLAKFIREMWANPGTPPDIHDAAARVLGEPSLAHGFSEKERTMTKPAVYIAGPMRGHPEFNFPAFDEAESMLKASKEYSYVYSPANIDRANGFDPTGMKGTAEELIAAGFSVINALQADLDLILNYCDEVYMLPGWSKSAGATAERAVALAIGLKVTGAAA